MVPRRLLPAPTSECFHPSDRSIAGTQSSSTSRHGGRYGRRNHHGRASRTGRVKRPLHRGETEGGTKVLTPPRERRVIGGIEIDVPQGEHRAEEALGLAQWQPKDEPQRHCCLDREIREHPRSARSTGRHRSPRLNRIGGEPECHVTPLDESLLVLGPIPDAVSSCTWDAPSNSRDNSVPAAADDATEAANSARVETPPTCTNAETRQRRRPLRTVKRLDRSPSQP